MIPEDFSVLVDELSEWWLVRQVTDAKYQMITINVSLQQPMAMRGQPTSQYKSSLTQLNCRSDMFYSLGFISLKLRISSIWLIKCELRNIPICDFLMKPGIGFVTDYCFI